MSEKKVAGVLGFEPRMEIPKTAALPLGHTPPINVWWVYTLTICFSIAKTKKNQTCWSEKTFHGQKQKKPDLIAGLLAANSKLNREA